MRTFVQASRLLAMALLISGLAGCNGNGPEMLPGDNCLRCHASGSGAPPFSFAGTVFSAADSPTSNGLSGVTVTLTDADAKVVTLTSNHVGNFYTNEAINFPATVSVQLGSTVVKMLSPVMSGDCSSCHTVPGQQNAPGRLFAAP